MDNSILFSFKQPLFLQWIVEARGLTFLPCKWRRKIARKVDHLCISPPVVSGNRKFFQKSFRFFCPNALLMSIGKCKEIVPEFFVKTLLPSSKRRRGKKISKVFGQTGNWSPVVSGNRKNFKKALRFFAKTALNSSVVKCEEKFFKKCSDFFPTAFLIRSGE